MQSESSDYDMPDTATATTATTAGHNADFDPSNQLSLDVNTLAKATISTADTAAEEKAAARETADTPQAQTTTAVTVGNKAHCDTPDELVVKTLAEASRNLLKRHLDCTA